MTELEQHTAVERYAKYMPATAAVRYLDNEGTPVESSARYPRPGDDRLTVMYRRMVVGRRFDQQATALTKQGRLAVYPSSRGQDACQISAAMCLQDSDWLFPTYRDSMCLQGRGVPPADILAGFTGEWHCGYDPVRYRTAPQSTPLATQLLHAAGFAHAQHRRGRETIALALCGDGGTSEGDFHEALNFAAVFKAPVVFLVQNNGFAISVPLARQSAAPSLAHKGVGYGIGSEQVDGNDPIAMLSVLDEAARFVRAGNGPVLIEAHTYRMEPHTNADDATRYRDPADVEVWAGRDPLVRLEKYLIAQGCIDDGVIADITAEADAVAADLRAAVNSQRTATPSELFAHVFAEPTSQLRQQQAELEAEMADNEMERSQ